MTIEAKHEEIARIVERAIEAAASSALTGDCDEGYRHACMAADAIMALAEPKASDTGFRIGARVEKKSGSSWRGTIVGSYSTELTPVGWAVESETETGSVQIYPEKALRLLPAKSQEPSEERAREVLAEEWEKEGRRDLSSTIRIGRDTEWNKAAVAIRAMIRFAKEVRHDTRT